MLLDMRGDEIMEKMQSIKRMIVTFVILFVVMAGIQANAAVSHNGRSVNCELNAKKKVDSAFMDSVYGHCYILSLSCTPHSAHGVMAVLRGRQRYDKDAVWVMYPALTCSKGKVVSSKYDVYAYARDHGYSSNANQVGIRMYGNHCDNQKTGCYGSALATNTN